MLDIQTKVQDSFHILRLSGQLCASEADVLEKNAGELCAGPAARVVVDLAGLTSIDSSGLSALIQLVTRSRVSGGRVVLVAPSPFVAGILSVTRLDRWFDIAPTVDAARQQLHEE